MVNDGVTESSTDINSSTTSNSSSQSTVTVNFDITVPAYQSNELRVELTWNDRSLNASWVGDEYWSAVGDFLIDTEYPLTVTFYDLNGGLELAIFTDVLRTGSTANEAFQITADQFNANLFDTDGDGVNNLAELIAGSSPLVDEDSLLEVRDHHVLSRSNRMSVWSDLESFVSDQRPYSDVIETDPPYAGFIGDFFGDINIDINGNGTLTYGYYWPIEQLRFTGTRIHSGRSISWEGTRSAYDGDYRHNVSFSHTVSVVDENTRKLVEDVNGTNYGGYLFSWETSANLTGTLIDGTSLCEPVAGTFSATYRDTPTEVSEYLISKEIDDRYWRVSKQLTTNRSVTNIETTEYFVRELIKYLPPSTLSSEVAPENKYFNCDFVDF